MRQKDKILNTSLSAVVDGRAAQGIHRAVVAHDLVVGAHDRAHVPADLALHGGAGGGGGHAVVRHQTTGGGVHLSAAHNLVLAAVGETIGRAYCHAVRTRVAVRHTVGHTGTANAPWVRSATAHHLSLGANCRAQRFAFYVVLVRHVGVVKGGEAGGGHWAAFGVHLSGAHDLVHATHRVLHVGTSGGHSGQQESGGGKRIQNLHSMYVVLEL